MLQGTVPACMQHVLSVAREFDLVQTWNKARLRRCRAARLRCSRRVPSQFLLDTTVVHAASLLQVEVYAGLWVPYPLTDRDFLVSVRGVDALDEHGCLVVLFSSCNRAPHELPPGAASRVRMRWQRACLRLVPLPGGATRGSLVAHVNPRMPGDIEPPAWAVSWALRVLCPFIFAAACRRVADIGMQPDCIYAQRIAANSQLYEMVRLREEACRSALPTAAAPASAVEDAAAPAPRRYMPAFLAGAGWST